MKSYTLEDAKGGLEFVLEEAKREGSVCIEDAQGQRYLLAHQATKSPLAVRGVSLGVSLAEILAAIHEGRKESTSPPTDSPRDNP